MIAWILICAVIFLITALPLKNWLEIRVIRKKEKQWLAWLLEKPSRTEYCAQNGQRVDAIKCDYCGSGRQLPSLEMAIASQAKFGVVSNTFIKYTYFKTHICSGCGTQLYREKYEE